MTALSCPVGDPVDHPEHRLRVLRTGHPVDRHHGHVRARDAAARARPSTATARAPARRSASPPGRGRAGAASTSSKHSDSGAHSSRSPRRRSAPTLFGPRARISAGAMRHDQVVAGPTPRPPRTTSSCRCRSWPGTCRPAPLSTSSVAARSSASSTWLGSIDSAGAQLTSAPRRSSSAICSSTFRAAVTPIRNPAQRSRAPSRTLLPPGRRARGPRRPARRRSGP